MPEQGMIFDLAEVSTEMHSTVLQSWTVQLQGTMTPEAFAMVHHALYKPHSFQTIDFCLPVCQLTDVWEKMFFSSRSYGVTDPHILHPLP